MSKKVKLICPECQKVRFANLPNDEAPDTIPALCGDPECEQKANAVQTARNKEINEVIAEEKKNQRLAWINFKELEANLKEQGYNICRKCLKPYQFKTFKKTGFDYRVKLISENHCSYCEQKQIQRKQKQLEKEQEKLEAELTQIEQEQENKIQENNQLSKSEPTEDILTEDNENEAINQKMSQKQIINLNSEERKLLSSDKLGLDFIQSVERHNRLLQQKTCSRCVRIIQPGETYYQLKSNSQTIHCPACREAVQQEIKEKIKQSQQNQTQSSINQNQSTQLNQSNQKQTKPKASSGDYYSLIIFSLIFWGLIIWGITALIKRHKRKNQERAELAKKRQEWEAYQKWKKSQERNKN